MNPMSAISSMFGADSSSDTTGSQGNFMQELMQMMEQLMQGGGQSAGDSQKSGGSDVLGEIGGIVKDVAPLALAFL